MNYAFNYHERGERRQRRLQAEALPIGVEDHVSVHVMCEPDWHGKVETTRK